jgi:hypothetical protein
MCTTPLNDGIFRVHQLFVVTPARLLKSDFVFQFYVYGGIFDNPPGCFLSARGTGCFCFFLLFNVNSGVLIPRSSTARREGWRISFARILFLVIMLVVNVFVVYISLRDDRHSTRINQSINCLLKKKITQSEE